jgi:hypothetical protein
VCVSGQEIASQGRIRTRAARSLLKSHIYQILFHGHASLSVAVSATACLCLCIVCVRPGKSSSNASLLFDIVNPRTSGQGVYVFCGVYVC